MTNDLKLWRFNLDFGRMGDLDGVFAATTEDVAKVVGENIYYGEALGKHSEIEAVFDIDQVQELRVSASAVAELVSAVGPTISGYNPLEIHAEFEEFD